MVLSGPIPARLHEDHARGDTQYLKRAIHKVETRSSAVAGMRPNLKQALRRRHAVSFSPRTLERREAFPADAGGQDIK
jgi:hypothetical protein